MSLFLLTCFSTRRYSCLTERSMYLKTLLVENIHWGLPFSMDCSTRSYSGCNCAGACSMGSALTKRAISGSYTRPFMWIKPTLSSCSVRLSREVSKTGMLIEKNGKISVWIFPFFISMCSFTIDAQCHGFGDFDAVDSGRHDAASIACAFSRWV